jgi:hypothetical protein
LFISREFPRAYAWGFILPPLRGWGTRLFVFRNTNHAALDLTFPPV